MCTYLIVQISRIVSLLIHPELLPGLRVDVLLLLQRCFISSKLTVQPFLLRWHKELTSRGPAQKRPVLKICLYNDSTLVREACGI